MKNELNINLNTNIFSINFDYKQSIPINLSQDVGIHINFL